MRYLALLLLMITSMSCGLMSERQFVNEMDQGESELWVADQDFPVVSGDTGQAYRTRREVISRTPASYGSDSSNQQYYLQRELQKLENAQNQEQFNHYMEYKSKLLTLSEKIYFLKLPNQLERERYVYAKGLYDSPYFTRPEQQLAAANRDIVIGMSKDDVIRSWGRPDRVDVAGDPRYQNERWLFEINGLAKFVYFEQGRVDGWEDAF